MDAAQVTAKLVHEADRRRRAATAELDQASRGDLGQFMTAADVAGLMASMFGPLPENVRLLDAGAGVGGLTAAFVAEACSRGQRPGVIIATAFEIEDVLVPHLRNTLAACRRTCEAAGLRFTGQIEHQDFLEAAADALGGSLFAKGSLQFEAAILNPPYRKIGTDSRERRLVQRVGLDATNLYAAFVALSIRLLVPGGQLVAIIPRSFCNGPYFRPFREILFRETALLRIHVFESRKDAFKDDRVLQENVILYAKRSSSRPNHVVVSSNHAGSEDVTERRLPFSDVVREANGDKFIHLPTDDDDDAVSEWLNQLPETLLSLGLSVSTGRVVDFRAREHLLKEPKRGSAPLIYPCHFVEGQIRWPKFGSRKPNAIRHSAATEALLVPRGYYAVTKRFSSKEERRRLVAAVYDPDLVDASSVGFENHLNYFHRDGHGLSKEEAYGLAAFLNSEPIDTYFRQFNGHTQVNANDLRSLRYPRREVLQELGSLLLKPGSDDLEQAVLRKCPLR
jgi:adenine-specific DNA-methyltransferase